MMAEAGGKLLGRWSVTNEAHGGGVMWSKKVRAALVASAFSVPALVVTASAQEAPPNCNGHPPTLVGTAGSDTIDGTPLRDVIHSLQGNDTVQGLGGRDDICGGDGADHLSGGAALDYITGQNGNDVISGGGNPSGRTQFLYGGTGDDTIRGIGPGNYIDGGPGSDTLIGGTANDHLVSIDGIAGNDTLDGRGGGDLCSIDYDTATGAHDMYRNCATIDLNPVSAPH